MLALGEAEEAFQHLDPAALGRLVVLHQQLQAVARQAPGEGGEVGLFRQMTERDLEPAGPAGFGAAQGRLQLGVQLAVFAPQLEGRGEHAFQPLQLDGGGQRFGIRRAGEEFLAQFHALRAGHPQQGQEAGLAATANEVRAVAGKTDGDRVKGHWRSSETGFISGRAKAAGNAPAAGR